MDCSLDLEDRWTTWYPQYAMCNFSKASPKDYWGVARVGVPNRKHDTLTSLCDGVPSDDRLLGSHCNDCVVFPKSIVSFGWVRSVVVDVCDTLPNDERFRASGNGGIHGSSCASPALQHMHPHNRKKSVYLYFQRKRTTTVVTAIIAKRQPTTIHVTLSLDETSGLTMERAFEEQIPLYMSVVWLQAFFLQINACFSDPSTIFHAYAPKNPLRTAFPPR